MKLKLKKLSRLIKLKSFILNANEFSVDRTYIDQNGDLYQKCECGGGCACCVSAKKPANLYIGHIKDIDLHINFI